MKLRRSATPIIALVALLVLGATAYALRSSTVGARPDPKLGKTVAVDAKGRTLYALSGETTRHLKCTSSACLAIWPPATVSRTAKLTVGKAVHGKLGTLRRSGGKRQLTLRGKPLYRYSGDSGPDDVNGEGIKSFGGTWHAVLASGGVAASKPAPSAPAYPSPY
jgi:predicted lipoprotein with Yx(FWY)xxD motif